MERGFSCCLFSSYFFPVGLGKVIGTIVREVRWDTSSCVPSLAKSWGEYCAELFYCGPVLLGA